MQATQTETLADRINRTTNGMLTIMQALRPLLKTYFALLKNPLWAALQTQPNDDDPFFECSPQYLHRVTVIALSYVYAQLDKLEAFGLVQYRMWEQYRLYRINEVAVTNIESFCKLVSMDKLTPVEDAKTWAWCLSDPLRYAIWEALKDGDMTGKRIEEMFGLAQPTASMNLSFLRKAGLAEYLPGKTRIIRWVSQGLKLESARSLFSLLSSKFQNEPAENQ
jgi:DNA-binding transcriptional ArsR family regulator